MYVDHDIFTKEYFIKNFKKKLGLYVRLAFLYKTSDFTFSLIIVLPSNFYLISKALLVSPLFDW